MSRIFTFALLLSLLGSTSHAQHDALVELYGEGVHRYFDNDFLGADQILTTVVDSGSQDPRVHYFRGLARERSGFDSQLDFEAGARLEAEGRRVVDVGAALTRVQGTIRTKLEEARRDARIVVKQQQVMAEQERLDAQPARPAEPDQPPGTAGISPFPTDLVPANDAGLAPPPPVPTVPAVPAVPAEVNDTNNPFADDVPAAPVPPAAETPAPAETEPATPSEPFGTPSADGGNPFGDAPTPGATPPADAAPADAAPADSDNPFGL